MRLLKTLLGLLLLPAWIGFSIAFLEQMYSINTTNEGLSFLVGALAFDVSVVDFLREGVLTTAEVYRVLLEGIG